MGSPAMTDIGPLDTEAQGVGGRRTVLAAAVGVRTALVHRGRRWIPALIAVAALYGLGAPTLPTTGAVARVFSCPGWTFMPFADTPYSMIGNARVISAGLTGAQTTVFTCNASLRHGATVTGVSFALVDWASFAQVANCQLKRTGLQFGYTEGGPGDVLASVPATGEAATPGVVRYTDSTITNGKVNNNRYGYMLRCDIDPSGGAPEVPWVGLFGASIAYTTG